MKPIALIISTQRCDTAPMMKVVTATQKMDTRNVTRYSRSDSVPTPHRPPRRPLFAPRRILAEVETGVLASIGLKLSS